MKDPRLTQGGDYAFGKVLLICRRLSADIYGENVRICFFASDIPFGGV